MSKKMNKANIQRFTEVYKAQSMRKLSANELICLNQPIYRDYLRTIKRTAGNNHYKVRSIENKKIEPLHEKMYYYDAKNEIVSLQEFILLMNEARKKQSIIIRKQKRKNNQYFIQKVQNRIQTADPLKLRLTSSSAFKIDKKFKQIRLNKDKL